MHFYKIQYAILFNDCVSTPSRFAFLLENGNFILHRETARFASHTHRTMVPLLLLIDVRCTCKSFAMIMKSLIMCAVWITWNVHQRTSNHVILLPWKFYSKIPYGQHTHTIFNIEFSIVKHKNKLRFIRG